MIKTYNQQKRKEGKPNEVLTVTYNVNKKYSVMRGKDLIAERDTREEAETYCKNLISNNS